MLQTGKVYEKRNIYLRRGGEQRQSATENDDGRTRHHDGTD